MVALFVVATIIIFLGIDYFVQRAAKRKAALSPAAQVSAKPRFMIPKGYFFGKGHTWVELLPDGLTRVGLDDFVQKILGPVGEVEPIPVNTIVRKGDKLFTVRQGGKEMSFRAPISGKVVAFNDDLSHSPGRVAERARDREGRHGAKRNQHLARETRNARPLAPKSQIGRHGRRRCRFLFFRFVRHDRGLPSVRTMRTRRSLSLSPRRSSAAANRRSTM